MCFCLIGIALPLLLNFRAKPGQALYYWWWLILMVNGPLMVDIDNWWRLWFDPDSDSVNLFLFSSVPIPFHSIPTTPTSTGTMPLLTAPPPPLPINCPVLRPNKLRFRCYELFSVAEFEVAVHVRWILVHNCRRHCHESARTHPTRGFHWFAADRRGKGWRCQSPSGQTVETDWCATCLGWPRARRSSWEVTHHAPVFILFRRRAGST